MLINKKVTFYGADSVEKTITIKNIQIEKGETATVYRPYSATGWLHSLKKFDGTNWIDASVKELDGSDWQ